LEAKSKEAEETTAASETEKVDDLTSAMDQMKLKEDSKKAMDSYD
jgi:hypothetical protein